MPLNIHHISDTHGHHQQLKIPADIDLLIFSGDATNPRDPYESEREMRKFITWYAGIPVRDKIFVGGNHDTCLEKGLITRENFISVGIDYLQDSYTTIEGFTIFGTPWTPRFGQGWAFNMDRSKTDYLWNSVQEGTDIIIAHGPPKGILDIASDDNRKIEYCGDLAMRKHIMNRIKPKLVCFGHIHDNDNNINRGTRTIDNIIFSNGSVVTDGKFGNITSNGNTIIL